MYTHPPLDWDIRRPVTDPLRAALAQVVNKAPTKDEPSPLSSSTTTWARRGQTPAAVRPHDGPRRCWRLTFRSGVVWKSVGELFTTFAFRAPSRCAPGGCCGAAGSGVAAFLHSSSDSRIFRAEQRSMRGACSYAGPARRRCAENDLLLGDQNWRLTHLFGDGLNRRDSIRHPVGCRCHGFH